MTRMPGSAGNRGLAAHLGYGLVELLVAIVVGLLVIAGTLAAYDKSRETYAAAETESRLQESARYALAILEADVRMAGYWGLTNRADLLTINAGGGFPAACGASWATDVAHAVDGYDGAYRAACPASGGGARAGTDVLIVRRASAQRITPQAAAIAAAYRTQVLVVTSRTAGEVFVPSATANLLPAGFANDDPAGQPPLADTRPLVVDAYYVSRNSSVANGYPALRRKTLNAGPSIGEEEVLPGIEDLQVEIGVDIDGDSSADLFVHPAAVPAGGQPACVRLWLRLRAQDADPRFVNDATYDYAGQSFTPSDHYRRLLVVKTIQLRNATP